MNKLTLTREGDTEIVAIRHFDAPPERVFQAHTDPALIRRWMLGPPGWTMPICLMEPRPGGRIEYVWEKPGGQRFGITGEILQIEPNARLVHTERMQLGERSVEYRVETRMDPHGTGTRLTMRMSFPDEATRREMLETGMEHGMEASYARIDPVLREGTAREPHP